MPDDESQHVPLAHVEQREADQGLRDECHHESVYAVAADGKRNADKAVTDRIARDAGQVNRLEIEISIQEVG